MCLFVDLWGFDICKVCMRIDEILLQGQILDRRFWALVLWI